ncbi:hypothetical protein [Cellulomonas timonensis]|uniref:hypothetical protein n=1 Tax=Cellulomonas timonensis TaxID=1689271 RepID=UPI00082DEC1A|nr:hypothetical protein [Cellulomonas timonensis]
MSLTDHLSDSHSPVRAFVDGLSPIFTGVPGTSKATQAMVRALGLQTLVLSRSVVPPPPGAVAALVGTAIDFRTRIALSDFSPHHSVAALGVARVAGHESQIKNGTHRVRVLTEAFEVANGIIESASEEIELDRAALLLAYCEQAYRGGHAALGGSLGDDLDRVDDGHAFALRVGARSLGDLRSLMEANETQINQWRGQIAQGERFEPNPVFAGSALVGGADGDWMVGRTLFDSKAYGKLSYPALRGFLRQLLGYVMLDLDDALGIRSVAVWLPRQGMTKSWPLHLLLGGDPEELLPMLRVEFQIAADGRRLAVREPVTQRRKHQLLADNANTPREMLSALALCEDIDLRFRVARNAATPELTVRDLARDRYARVREGAARNPQAPPDLLEVLSRDTSLMVRRAAHANPRTPRTSPRALESGRRPRSAPDAPAIEQARMAPGGVRPGASLAGHGRDDLSVDAAWFTAFLAATRGGTPTGPGPWLPLPAASHRWAAITGRELDIPCWLKSGLPHEVKEDLLRQGRPAWMRRAVAADLSVADAGVRNRLLSDLDPEIRWSALRRTADAPDDSLGDLLARLASDRAERTHFRKAGDDQPRGAGLRSPGELDTEMLELVAAHPSTPVTALRELMGTKVPRVLVALAGNPSLPAANLDALLPRLRSMRSTESRVQLAASTLIPAAVAGALIEDRDVGVRASLSRNPEVPTQVLARLALDAEMSVRLGVLANPSTPPDLASRIARPLLLSTTDETLLGVLAATRQRNDLAQPEGLVEQALDKLASNRLAHPNLRQIAAGDSRTAPRTLVRLARSVDASVRREVAENPRTPPGTLAALAGDPEPQVRAAAGRSRTLDLDRLQTLSRDEEADVRESAAGNPGLDGARLAEMLLDQHGAVRSAAFKNLVTSAEDRARAKTEWDKRWRDAAPSRADLEERAANALAQVRVQVARDPRTPPDILVFLAGERRSALVRRAVAANSNTPPEALASLSQDADIEVRRAVAFNSATSPATLIELADRSVDLAVLVTLNPDAPPAIIEALVNDSDQLVHFIADQVRAHRSLPRGSSSATTPELDV